MPRFRRRPDWNGDLEMTRPSALPSALPAFSPTKPPPVSHTFNRSRDPASILSKLSAGADATTGDGARSDSSPVLGHESTSSLASKEPLRKNEPIVRDMYRTYNQTRPEARPAFEPDAYSPDTDPWRYHALSAWFLSRSEKDRKFERYSLSQFIQNCALLIHGPWKYIEQGCSPRASLRRFADHWVAWNVHLAGGEDAAHEYRGLEAAAKTHELANGGGEDPRTYTIHHWFQACGANLDPKCVHVPRIRIEREEKAKREAEESPPEDTAGRSFEERRASQAGRGRDTSSSAATTLPGVRTARQAPIRTRTPTQSNNEATIQMAQRARRGVHSRRDKSRTVPYIFMLILLVQGSILMGMGGYHIERGTSFPGVRHTTIGYTVACGLGCVLMSFLAIMSWVYWVGGLGGAIASTVDWKNCTEFADGDTCKDMMKMMIFMWVSWFVSIPNFLYGVTIIG